MEVAILGPLVVRCDGREVAIGAAKQRALFTMLLLRRGQSVPVETLMDQLWDGRPPVTAMKVVQVYVSQLRKALGEGLIDTQPGGYRLRLEPDSLDAARFENMLTRGQALLSAGDARQAGIVLREALAMWRGPPLAEFRFEAFARGEIGRLEELRLVAVELRIEADLAVGQHHAVVAELEPLVREHPTREGLLRLYLLALYRTGRQADSLAAYETFRAALSDDLGLDPGESLQDLQTAILRHDAALAASPRVAAVQNPPGAEPEPSGAPSRTEPLPRVDREPSSPGTRLRRGRRRRALVTAGVVAAILVLAGGAAVALRDRGRPPATVAADSVGLIDAATGRVDGQVLLSGAPTAVAVGAGAVWVADTTAGTVSRIDPKTRDVQTIPVGLSPSGIAVGGGGVWVANHDDNTVSWISPQTNQVVQPPIPVGVGPDAVAYGFGSVWVTNSEDRTVTRIDASTGKVAATITTNAVGRGITVGGGAVWVTDEATNRIVKIDPTTNGVRIPAAVGSGLTGIAYGDGSLWVANTLDDTVVRVDPTTLTPLASIQVAGSPSAVSVTGNAVWVSAEYSSRVVRIDARTNTVVLSTAIGNRPQDIAAGGGDLWVAVQASGAGHRGGRLIVVGGAPFSIDPAVITAAFGLGWPVYDGLTVLSPASGSAATHIVPDLAAALPVPDDSGTSYTFPLRPGIRYSNGQPVRAADFRRALQRQLQLGASYPPFTLLAGADGCVRHRRCDLSRSVVVDGPLTLTFHLRAPDPRLFWELTGLAPVPAGTPAHDVGTAPVPGTGPYTIQSYAPGRLLTFVRNRYFRVWSAAARPDGYPDEIVYRVVSDPSSAARQVLDGRADLVGAAHETAAITDLFNRYPLQVHREPQLGATVFAFLNVKQPPFNDVRVRRALNYAVDRKRVVSLLGSQLAELTCQITPPGVPGYRRYCPYTVDPTLSGEWIGPDLPKAHALIDASGTKGEQIVLWSFPAFDPAGQYLRSLLDELGYHVRPHLITDGTGYFAQLAAHPNTQIGMFGWFGDQLAVDSFVTLGCHFDLNPSHFCDPAIDAQVQQLQNQQPVDPAGSAALAAKVDHELTDAAPWIPLFTPIVANLTSTRVGNYQVQEGNVVLDQLWIK